MTDARFPERWLNDRRLLRLSDPDFRLHVGGLVWSVANRTDGVLYDDDLALIPGVDPSGAARLAKAGLWRRDRDRWLIIDFADTQTSADELAALHARRQSDRERKARERASRDGHVTNPQDAPRPGQARPGAGQNSSEELPPTDLSARTREGDATPQTGLCITCGEPLSQTYLSLRRDRHPGCPLPTRPDTESA